MKSLCVFTFYILCLLQPLTSSAAIKDTIPANIKNYTKDQFLKEFAKDETSEKMIGFYFQEYKKAKRKVYVFPSLAVLVALYGVLQMSGPASGYSFLLALGAFVFSFAFLCSFIAELSNRRKYSPKGLYKQLMDYQAGKPLSKKLKRQLKYFNKS